MTNFYKILAYRSELIEINDVQKDPRKQAAIKIQSHYRIRMAFKKSQLIKEAADILVSINNQKEFNIT